MSEKTSQLRLQGGITPEQLRTAIIVCSEQKKSLIEHVLADEKVSEEGLADSISSYLRFPRVNLASTNVDADAVKLMPQDVARKHLCIPIRIENRHLHIAMANPTDYRAVQEVEFVLGRTVKVFVCTRTEITDAIERYYKTEDTLKEFTNSLDSAMDLKITSEDTGQAEVDISRSLTAAEMPPVVKVVNLIIQDAITQRGTDIHVEPTLNDVQVRIRVDGVLRPLMQLPKWLTYPVCSRLKVLSRLDIAERRIPQDGRLKVTMQGQAYDFRVSTLPTLFGEKVVMRILSSDTQLPTLDRLELDDHDKKTLLGSLMQPQGLILVTGPTGSGKTSTLVACLAHRKSPGLNIITVEDPVEYQLPGVNQVQVNTKTGLTFATALRSILRQDPDVVLVGEMRDLETTEIAFHAAMTGHLVLSTLHTNSALASLTRLLDLGVDPTLVNTAITLIIAQRLVRKLCKDCKRPYEPPAWMLEKMGISKKDATVYYEAVGCPKCGGTGYTGRVAVLEFLPMTKSLREMIANRIPEVEVKSALRRQGMKFLLDRGVEVARKGNTDLNELFRVLQLDTEEDIAEAHCPHCSAVIEPGFTICPSCMNHLSLVCRQCGQELKKDWKVCPYCKTRVEDEPLQLPSATFNLPAVTPEPNYSIDTAPAAEPAPTAPEASSQTSGRKKRRAKSQPQHADETSTSVATSAAETETQTAVPKVPEILIVDDDESIRTIVAKALQQLPFPIHTHVAADGMEALQSVENIHPDLVVLDVMMPGMDGFEVCAKLRSDVKTAFIPIMMLTANSNEQGRIKGYLVGADDYVAKPFSVPELHARVTRLLRRAYGIS